MKLPIRNSSKLIILALVLITAFGCQSKKKAMQAKNAAAEKAKMEQEAIDRKQAEEKAKRAAEEQARIEAEKRANESKVSTPSMKLGQYFSSISNSSNVASANANINEALSLFASPDTPVLIVISESDGMKDYDKPTTIRQYLNYLKDQKKNPNMISDIKTNGEGKITELELKKN